MLSQEIIARITVAHSSSAPFGRAPYLSPLELLDGARGATRPVKMVKVPACLAWKAWKAWKMFIGSSPLNG
jgi:hypothetical protein